MGLRRSRPLHFTAMQCAVVASAISLLSCAVAQADTHTIQFDDGGADKTTVIGLFKDNGLSYYQRVDFTLPTTDGLTNTRLRLHAHVGSRIQPAQGSDTCKVGLRVNGGRWHWRTLDTYRDDGDHWIEFRISATEWRPGLNSVETNSTVGSVGNMTPESLDIIGSGTGKIRRRSWHTHDLRSYVRLDDRNWGIRLMYETPHADETHLSSPSILTEKATASIGESVQFTLRAVDGSGKQIVVADAEWSATHGTVDEFGMYVPSAVGRGEVTAKVSSLRARATCDIEARPPLGVEGPESDKRLRPRVPAGHLALNGSWEFRLDPRGVGEKENWFDGAPHGEWSAIHVPGSWQAQGYGLDYHGIAWYRRTIRVPTDYSGGETWLRFDGVATSAKVWVNGTFAGEHTDNWAPFELRITDLVHPGEENTITVRVEELPGCFSAGFPLIVGMHFGGIWQPVSMYSTGKLHIDDVHVLPRLSEETAHVIVTVSGSGGGPVTCSVLAPDGKTIAKQSVDVSGSMMDGRDARTVSIVVPIAKPDAWSPEHPALYMARIDVQEGGKSSDHREVQFGMRDVSTEGSHLLLNGKPIFVRGVLHWGNYPGLISIDPSEEQIRREFAEIRKAGFNLVKVCMFSFPKRFYEIADETGMLIWQEYPLWLTFPQSADTNPHEEIVRAYEEWFRFDRNHPSVILRDLTCEAVDMNPDLTRRIYALGKSMTGGAVIEDNSAYMNQAFTDFYDAHMYRELDTQYTDIPGWLIPAIHSKGDLKPYLTGEDIDCDTYRDIQALSREFVRGDEIPWWLDNANFHLQESMEKDLIAAHGPEIIPELIRRQKLHALAMRRGLIEEYRQYPEVAGFVMTQIRDNPVTRPGFFDDLGHPKWDAREWSKFNDDRALILYSPRRSFCFFSDEKAQFTIQLSNYGSPLLDVPLRWSLLDGRREVASGESRVSAGKGTVSKVAECSIDCGPLGLGANPKQLRFTAKLGADGDVIHADWPVWVFPTAQPAIQGRSVCMYGLSDDSRQVLTQLGAVSIRPCEDSSWGQDGGGPVRIGQSVLVTDHLDEYACKALIGGARVVYIAGDGDDRLPRQDAPFWRELAIWLPTGHPALGDFPHRDFADRQFLDMTQRRPFNMMGFRSEITPLVWGVNCRFMSAQLADYVFETKVGKGSLLACCLRLSGAENVAGHHLLSSLTRYAAGDAFHPATSSGNLTKMLAEP